MELPTQFHSGPFTGLVRIHAGALALNMHLPTAMAFTSWAAIPPLFSFKYFLHKLQKGLLKPPDISPTELKLTVDEGRCQLFQNNTDFHWCDWVFCPTNLFQYTLYSESQGSDSY